MKKVKALAALKAKHGGDDDQPTSTGEFIHDGRSVFSMTAPVETLPSLPLLPNPPSVLEGPLPAPTSSALPNDSRPPPQKEPKPQVHDQFLQQKDHISSVMLTDYTSPLIEQPCSCGAEGAVCTTRCRDCFFYPPTCDACFVKAHRRSPTHWAHVWQSKGGYFLKTDISSLSTKPFIQLGHDGLPCKAVYEDNLKHNFLIVDNNGVHSTRLRFCACDGCPSPVDQLLQAQLFPATFEDPRTAFTFSVLKSYEAHHHESAESAYSFITALRHLTDPLFYDDVSDPYHQFRDVFKMWRLLKTEQRLGHHHGIDDVVSSRPPGSLLVRCPACPELGVNTEGAVCNDEALRHLNQIRLTADGNFRQNHLAKNMESRTSSFFDGRSYFPDTTEYNLHVKGPSGKSQEADVEKTECAFLKAANKQDKKKFIGCDISGVVNIQCPHVFVLSSVDLELGEKFVSTDFALQRALSMRYLPRYTPQYQDYLSAVDVVLSYDISCAYSAHAATRLGQFREIATFANRFRYTIPLLHIQNHNDNCTYMYSSAYTGGVGHFHGETAEHLWPYANLFASQARQMSHGNRHDLLIGVYGYWNFKKVIGLASQLYNELVRASKLRVAKRDAFVGLCDLYADKLSAWNKMSRLPSAPSRGRSKGEVQSPYRQRTSKVPSQIQIYNAMVTSQVDSSNEPTSKKGKKANKPVKAPKSADQRPVLCNMAVNVQRLQDQLKSKNKAHEKHPSDTLASEIKAVQTRLTALMERFRELQLVLFPSLSDHILEWTSSETVQAEDQTLGMPSDFDDVSRTELGLDELADLERRLLEGTAFDSISKIRTAVQFVSALTGGKMVNLTGQNQLTRIASRVYDAENLRDFEIRFYNSTRGRLLCLGLPEDDATFRLMDVASTTRKSTFLKRALGDTYKLDTFGRNSSGIYQRETHQPLITPQSNEAGSQITTQSKKLNKRKNEAPSKPEAKKSRLEDTKASGSGAGKAQEATSEPPNTGWIWEPRAPTGISDEEVEDWMSEGNRVQWFRAEAEMYRWQEEWEHKIAEFSRTIRFHHHMSNAWTALALQAGTTPGMTAYARRSAARYLELAGRCTHVFEQADTGYAGEMNDKEIFDFIQQDRSNFARIIQAKLVEHSAG
ncbi:hypothetical protein BKA70DRAFT_1575759 [Coprinopsis sp. MPI-PUGE-AT-0042]|nr:hypothetical protein BKA70DRAFT_1575759 [Coprinopsis sp. MPI-PUGE-AT-0042]